MSSFPHQKKQKPPKKPSLPYILQLFIYLTESAVTVLELFFLKKHLPPDIWNHHLQEKVLGVEAQNLKKMLQILNANFHVLLSKLKILSVNISFEVYQSSPGPFCRRGVTGQILILLNSLRIWRLIAVGTGDHNFFTPVLLIVFAYTGFGLCSKFPASPVLRTAHCRYIPVAHIEPTFALILCNKMFNS